jgi:hypothetical protein
LTDYADPDLETIAPLRPVAVATHEEPVEPPPGPDRGRWTALIVCVVVASLVVGFGVTTLLLNLTDKGSQSAVAVGPGTTTPKGDPDEGVLDGLIVNQDDVPAAYTVHHPQDGINLVAPTLDLCNGTFPSETQRTARRQVYVGATGADTAPFSTEAVLYHGPADGAQAMQELQSVAAQCPSTAVTSPVGEPTAITKFSAPPDTSWPKTPTVERQAYSFVTTYPKTNVPPTQSTAVYLRRGRALMGLYFAQPTKAQIPIEGQRAIRQIVAVFEKRMAQLPESVVNR